MQSLRELIHSAENFIDDIPAFRIDELVAVDDAIPGAGLTLPPALLEVQLAVAARKAEVARVKAEVAKLAVRYQWDGTGNKVVPPAERSHVD